MNKNPDDLSQPWPDHITWPPTKATNGASEIPHQPTPASIEQTSILTIEISQAACAAIWAAKTHHGEKPNGKTGVQMVEEVLEEYALAFLSYYQRHDADVERLINLWRKERDKKS